LAQRLIYLTEGRSGRQGEDNPFLPPGSIVW
jgi:hypothetical protein